MSAKSTVERALEIARSGDASKLTDIRRILKAEGWTEWRSHTDGPSLQRQLADLIASAKAKRPNEP